MPISELGEETFIAHNVLSPYREFVLRVFRERSVRLKMDIEMPTVETIRWMVESNQGVAFLPRMCVEQEIAEKRLVAVRVPEIEAGAEDLSGAAVAARGELCGGCVFETGDRMRVGIVLLFWRLRARVHAAKLRIRW